MSILAYIQSQQRAFHEQMSGYLVSLQQEHSASLAFAVMFAGFLYGFFHAIGPGHGKIIISSYMFASKSTLTRGLAITFASALMQALVAILLVLGLWYGLGFSRHTAENTAYWLEMVSFGLITVLGVWMIVRGVRQFTLHHHHHHHDGDCCSHTHAPTPKQLEKAETSAAIFMMIVSIGIRPCSGALLMLFFACLTNVAWAGILGVLAMAVGTALSTSFFAVAALGSRNLALKVAQSNDRIMRGFYAVFSIFGGLIIAAVGALFFLATSGMVPASNLSETPVTPSNHPLMRPLNP